MARKLNEDTHPIDLFIDINSDNKNKGLLKTITNYVTGNVISNSVLVSPEDSGSNSLTDVFDVSGVDPHSLNSAIQDFRSLSTDRFRQYQMYEEMSDDILISSALDLYADDSTQSDVNGRKIWASSDSDPNYQQIVDNLINVLKLEKNIRKISRQLAKFGDVYLELFYDESNPETVVKLTENEIIKKSSRKEWTNSISELFESVYGNNLNESIELSSSEGKLPNYFEIVTDPQNIFDLQLEGQTVAYARLVGDDQSIQYTPSGYIAPSDGAIDVRYYPPDKFVHICLDQSDIGEYYEVETENNGKFRFKILRGKSMLHDVFRAQRELELLEYSLLLNRISRSSVIRLVQIEVGNMSPSKIQSTLRRVKSMIEQKTSMNTESGSYRPYLNPGPIENFVYIPTRDGTGSVTMDTIGGDINVRDIADVDHFANRVFSGLKIPKAFLNFDDDSLSAFSGGQTLTKMDARYARTIKMLQGYLIEGMRDLVDVFLSNRGLDNVIGNYRIKMVSPSSIEDQERDETLSTRTTVANDLLDMLSAISEPDNVSLNMDKLSDYVANKIFDDADLKSIIVVSDSPDASSVSPGDVEGIDIENSGGNSVQTDIEPPSPETPEDIEPSSDFGGEWSDIEV